MHTLAGTAPGPLFRHTVCTSPSKACTLRMVDAEGWNTNFCIHHALLKIQLRGKDGGCPYVHVVAVAFTLAKKA